MNLDSEAAGKKLLQFNVFTTAYKTVNECAITLDILVPKEIRQGKRPLLVRFHGGGLVCNDSEATIFMLTGYLDHRVKLIPRFLCAMDYGICPSALCGHHFAQLPLAPRIDGARFTG